VTTHYYIHFYAIAIGNSHRVHKLVQQRMVGRLRGPSKR